MCWFYSISQKLKLAKCLLHIAGYTFLLYIIHTSFIIFYKEKKFFWNKWKMKKIFFAKMRWSIPNLYFCVIFNSYFSFGILCHWTVKSIKVIISNLKTISHLSFLPLNLLKKLKFLVSFFSFLGILIYLNCWQYSKNCDQGKYI